MSSNAIVLCYHALSEDWPAELTVRPDSFERQIEMMLDRGYVASTFGALARDRPAAKTFVVTFDDAFRSVAEIALPILRSYEVPATVFAVSSFASRGGPLRWKGIDQWAGGPYERELEGMTWDELRDLLDLGWEVGGHSATHPRLTLLGDDRLREELVSSREECIDELGACETIAYPYGGVDRRVADAAGSAGYIAGAALTSRAHRLEEFGWPRIGIWRDDDLRRFRLKISRPVRRARLLLSR